MPLLKTNSPEEEGKAMVGINVRVTRIQFFVFCPTKRFNFFFLILSLCLRFWFLFSFLCLLLLFLFVDYSCARF